MAYAEGNTKSCSRCKKILATAMFNVGRRLKDGLQYHCRECQKETYFQRRDAALATMKRWRVLNKDLKATLDRIYREKNIDTYRARSRARWQNDSEKMKAYYKIWREANQEIRRACHCVRRAKKRAAPGRGWTAADVAEIKIAQRSRYAICRDRLPKQFHRDHIMPLARGGAHDRRNLQLTCGPCNSSKGARDPIDHARSLGRLL